MLVKQKTVEDLYQAKEKFSELGKGRSMVDGFVVEDATGLGHI